MLSEVEVEVEVVPVLVVAAELPVEAGFEVLDAAKAAVDAVSDRANRDEKRVLDVIVVATLRGGGEAVPGALRGEYLPLPLEEVKIWPAARAPSRLGQRRLGSLLLHLGDGLFHQVGRGEGAAAPQPLPLGVEEVEVELTRSLDPLVTGIERSALAHRLHAASGPLPVLLPLPSEDFEPKLRLQCKAVLALIPADLENEHVSPP